MISTFSNWARLFPKVELLLEAGFYFTGVMDSVAGIECGVEIFEWLDNDNPFKEHKNVSPDYKMVKNKTKG
ncbi:death-associated inhibitor of apoptosis 1-like isoform X3 [Lycorma delicatula]|uniref:death-associated inhibitor of apoptosis 1-like isoform X3 n=1 Tax=Lycorma delicatula TaxID=130591 RepID=UPI003F514B3E